VVLRRDGPVPGSGAQTSWRFHRGGAIGDETTGLPGVGSVRVSRVVTIARSSSHVRRNTTKSSRSHCPNRVLRARRRAAAEKARPYTADTRQFLDTIARRVLKPAGRLAGVRWLGFHTFRHTCATMLLRADWNAKQVQITLGHHSPACTLATYLHFLDDDLPDTSFLDDLTGEGGNRAATSPTEMTSRLPLTLPGWRVLRRRPGAGLIQRTGDASLQARRPRLDRLSHADGVPGSFRVGRVPAHVLDPASPRAGARNRAEAG
jgi:hypothetical protein